MAGILDKLLPATQRRAVKLSQDYAWIRTEYEALPQVYQSKKEEKLQAFAKKANKKLLPVAYAACDKEAYASAIVDEKLSRYDIKAYRSHRAANHKAVKGIFKAVHAGKDWSDVISRNQAENDRILAKRQAYAERLRQEKAVFLQKNTASDASVYEAQSSQLKQEYQSLSQTLDAQYADRLQTKQAKLQAKMDGISRKIDKINAKQTQKYHLEENVILSVKGLKMYFGGLKAVDDLSFDVKKGEIFGLIGPNGAGKTTVFNCITQFYKPTDGQLLFKRKDSRIISLTDYPVHNIVLQGIARTFQNVETVKEVSVLDNLLIAATRQYTSGLLTQMLHLPLLAKEERVIRARANKILEYMDLTAYRDRLCWGLPYGVLKRVEIARALMCNPQLIIFDEPAAGLNESETSDLARLINNIRNDFDCTILLVEHDMSLVMNVCDHICAISFGKKLAEGTAKDIQSSKAVQEAYLGMGGE